jgi:formylglycine-generating enzyme required for sulfatase activity/serine/threonine protein kinase
VTDALIGNMLGPYEIVALLDEAGAVETYEGYDTAGEKPVRIRIIRREDQRVQGFGKAVRRELNRLAALQHPNIAAVQDFGQTDGGYYLVTDYPEGAPLTVLLANRRDKTRPPNSRDVTFLIRQIAAALDYAHASGIVHRALTPDSIFVTRNGQAIVTDFGLALLADSVRQEGEVPPLPQEEYGAPELQTGLVTASPASDVYSLGVILYELLTGELPYRLDSDIDLALRDLSDTAPDPRLLTPTLPGAVAQVTQKALMTSPRERYQGAMRLAAALEHAYYEGVSPEKRPEPYTVPPPGGSPPGPAIEGRPATRPAEKRRRRPVRAFLVFVVLLLVVGALGLLLNTLSVIALPVERVPALAGVLPASPTPQPTADPSTPTPTSIPSPTVVPTATPLQAAAATPIPAVAAQPLDAGTSAFRLADGAEMQFVPAGAFLMGTDDFGRKSDARPQHTVMLSDYWIDRTEVTNAQYTLCVDAGLCDPPVTRRYFDSPNYAHHPVTYVRYTQAVSYCLWLAGETGQPVGLPTEAQWEKAAAWNPFTETAHNYPWGDSPPNPDLLSYSESFAGGAAPVGSYPDGASAYGVYDMAGNVWEWVADWYDANAYKSSGVASDPTGPASGTRRVTRGGGWLNAASLVVVNVRNWATPTAAGDDLGFRCALNTRRPDPESGIYLRPLDLARTFADEIARAQAAGAGDAATLDEWAASLDLLQSALAEDDTQTALAAVEDRLVRLTVQRSSELIDPQLALRLDGGLLWMREQLTPDTE